MKKPKPTLKFFNRLIKLILVALSVGLIIAYFISPENWSKPASYIVTIPLVFGMDILKFFGLGLSDRFETAYLLFLIPAMVLGINFDWYKTVYLFGEPCFDKVAHALSGVLSAFAAKEILDKAYDGLELTTKGDSHIKTRRYNRAFMLLFLVATVALIAVLWEIFEFSYDQITGGSMQQLIAPGVDDTMWDLIAALGCGFVVSIPLSKK